MSNEGNEYVLAGLVRTASGDLTNVYAEDAADANCAYFLDDSGDIYVIEGLNASGIKGLTTSREEEQLHSFYDTLEQADDDIVGVIMVEDGYIGLTDVTIGGGYYKKNGDEEKEQLDSICIYCEDSGDVDSELLSVFGI